MTIANAVKNRIIQLCKKDNITINKLSTVSGITQSTLNNIINGGSKDPKLSTIKKVCDGLGITLSEFFSTEEFNELDEYI